MLVVVLATFVITWLPNMLFVILLFHLNVQDKGENGKHKFSGGSRISKWGDINPIWFVLIYYLAKIFTETA